MSAREEILKCVPDMITDFLYYDRKEDDDCPRGMIEEAIKNEEISVADIVCAFELELNKGLGLL